MTQPYECQAPIRYQSQDSRTEGSYITYSHISNCPQLSTLRLHTISSILCSAIYCRTLSIYWRNPPDTDASAIISTQPIRRDVRPAADPLNTLAPPTSRRHRFNNTLLFLFETILHTPYKSESGKSGRCGADCYDVPTDREEGDHMGLAAERGKRGCYYGKDTGEREP